MAAPAAKMKPIDSTERMCLSASTTGPAMCVCGSPPSGCSFSRTRFRSRHATIARARNAIASAVQKTDRVHIASSRQPHGLSTLRTDEMKVLHLLHPDALGKNGPAAPASEVDVTRPNDSRTHPQVQDRCLFRGFLDDGQPDFHHLFPPLSKARAGCRQDPFESALVVMSTHSSALIQPRSS